MCLVFKKKSFYLAVYFFVNVFINEMLSERLRKAPSPGGLSDENTFALSALSALPALCVFSFSPLFFSLLSFKFKVSHLMAATPPPLSQALAQSFPPPNLPKEHPLSYLHFAIYTNLFKLSKVSPIAFGLKTNLNTPKDLRLFVLPRLHFMHSQVASLPFTNDLIGTKHQLLQVAITHYIHYFQNPKKNKAYLSKAISLQKLYLKERKTLNDFFFSQKSPLTSPLRTSSKKKIKKITRKK